MAGGREIKTKIKSVQNTRKVTRALEMVSASKIRKAQDRMKASRPYARAMKQVIGHLAQANSEYQHPYLVQRADVKRVGYIIVSSDRGLAGGLNNNLFRKLLGEIRRWHEQGVEVDVVTIGQKASVFFRRIKVDMLASVTHLGDQPHVDQLVHVRLVAQVGDRREHVDLDAAEEHRRLLADGDDVDLDALLVPPADLAEQLAEQVVVEAAGQAAVGRDDDVADALHVRALHQVRVLVLGVGLRQVADDLLHRTGVRARGLHAVLRLADLRGGDHLERARHLAGVLHALDLRLDFATTSHFVSLLSSPRRRGSSVSFQHPWIPAFAGMTGYQEPVFLNSSMPALKAASSSSFQSPVALIFDTSSPRVLAKCACRPSSNEAILLTGTSSM